MTTVDLVIWKLRAKGGDEEENSKNLTNNIDYSKCIARAMMMIMLSMFLFKLNNKGFDK